MDQSLHILIAEDSEDDVFIFEQALKRAGLPNPVHVCRDGEEVIEYITGEGRFSDRQRYPFPRMLILDIKMPKLSGLEVLHWVRSHPECAAIPTIILTSSAHPQDVKDAFASGVSAYFTKPSAPAAMQELLALIHKFWAASVLPPNSSHSPS